MSRCIDNDQIFLFPVESRMSNLNSFAPLTFFFVGITNVHDQNQDSRFDLRLDLFPIFASLLVRWDMWTPLETFERLPKGKEREGTKTFRCEWFSSSQRLLLLSRRLSKWNARMTIDPFDSPSDRLFLDVQTFVNGMFSSHTDGFLTVIFHYIIISEIDSVVREFDLFVLGEETTFLFRFLFRRWTEFSKTTEWNSSRRNSIWRTILFLNQFEHDDRTQNEDYFPSNPFNDLHDLEEDLHPCEHCPTPVHFPESSSSMYSSSVPQYDSSMELNSFFSSHHYVSPSSSFFCLSKELFLSIDDDDDGETLLDQKIEENQSADRPFSFSFVFFLMNESDGMNALLFEIDLCWQLSANERNSGWMNFESPSLIELIIGQWQTIGPIIFLFFSFFRKKQPLVSSRLVSSRCHRVNLNWF